MSLPNSKPNVCFRIPLKRQKSALIHPNDARNSVFTSAIHYDWIIFRLGMDGLMLNTKQRLMSEGWNDILCQWENIWLYYSENKTEESPAVDRGAGSELSPGDAEEAADSGCCQCLSCGLALGVRRRDHVSSVRLCDSRSDGSWRWWHLVAQGTLSHSSYLQRWGGENEYL